MFIRIHKNDADAIPDEVENFSLIFHVIPLFPTKTPLAIVGCTTPVDLVAMNARSQHQFAGLDSGMANSVIDRMRLAYPSDRFEVVWVQLRVMRREKPANVVPLYLDAIIDNPLITSDETRALEVAAGEKFD